MSRVHSGFVPLIITIICIFLFTNFCAKSHTSSSANNKTFIVSRERANASHVQPLGRPDRKYEARNTTETLIAGNYAKIAARPKGQYHAFVSHIDC